MTSYECSQYDDYNDFELEPATERNPRPRFQINEDYVELFLSVSSTIRVTVNGTEIDASPTIDRKRDENEIQEWSLNFIRQNVSKLNSLNVDVEYEYVHLGGNFNDIKS